MFNAEVLSKFPVVQHFPFGSLFSWGQDPDAAPVSQSVHTANQPPSSSSQGAPTKRPLPQEGTRASWASQAPVTAPGAHPTGATLPSTKAPWASQAPETRPAPYPGTAMPSTGVPSSNAPPGTRKAPPAAVDGLHGQSRPFEGDEI